MNEPIFNMDDDAAFWELLRRRKIDGYDPTWDEVVLRPADIRPGPINRQQRRAAERTKEQTR